MKKKEKTPFWIKILTRILMYPYLAIKLFFILTFIIAIFIISLFFGTLIAFKLLGLIGVVIV